MILLKISSQNEEKLERIAEILLRDNLAIDINILQNLVKWERQNEKLVKTQVNLLTAKTKALLFQQIINRFEEEFPNDMPEVYSLPIVNMDWEQSQKLAESVMSI